MDNVRCKLMAAAIILLVSLVLMGCATLPAAAPTLPTTDPTLTAPTEPTPEITTMPPTSTRPSPRPTPRATAARRDTTLLETAARRDLAQRLNITEDQVQVVSVEEREMPAGSLGCGETGGRQNQGLLMGDEIVLQAGGQKYTYRTDGRKLVPCAPAAFPGGQRPLYVTGAQPTAQPTILELAVTDLAGRLGITPSAITVRQVIEVEWPDASLGCPQPGMMYAQVITPGQRIVLQASGRTYEYHAGQGHVILCRP